MYIPLNQTLEIEEIQSNETVEDYWDRIFKITGLGEVSRFGKLSKLIQVGGNWESLSVFFNLTYL